MTNTTFKTTAWPLTLSALTLAVSALVHGGASAAASEEQLKKIKLYGDVSIAEDSVGSWGPWSQFEPPAAGPAAMDLPKRVSDPYRPLPQPLPEPVPPAELGCLGGALCGFGAFNQVHLIDGVAAHSDYFSAVLTGEITQVDDHSWPKAIRLTTAAFDPAVTVLLPDSGELLRWETGVEGDGHQIAYRRGIDDRPSEHFADVVVDLSDESQLGLIQVAGVRMTVGDYILGLDRSGKEQFMQGEGVGGYAVMGRATPVADMAALRANQATATYIGFGGYYTPNTVMMDVQFGPGTWSGTWNGGKDGFVVTDSLPNQQGVRLVGQVGFTASGVIEGVNIRSTSVGAADAGATVSGSVRGAFFGPNAAAVGGVADITKTNPGVAVPAASGSTSGGYTNGRYIAPFLAIDSKLLRKLQKE